ncbi:MAG: hypothetical protein WBL06_07260 [Pseudolysinimonas sp.]|uniref:hypothetical protein n=1 Tax=Pseudolysinimonas sp. TaxID=2680009 RepID=UPI003C74AC73
MTYAFGPDDVRSMWAVLAEWAEKSIPDGEPTPLSRTLSQIFQPVGRDQLLYTLPEWPLPISMQDEDWWLIGAPLHKQKEVIPVLTARLDKRSDGYVKDAIFYVALFRERPGEGSIDVEGWRFEQEEDEDAAHPYAHAQAVTGWRQGSDCLIHSPHPERNCEVVWPSGDEAVDVERVRAHRATLDKHPAFPLPVSTLTGLALALITSLYGAPTVVKMLRPTELLGRQDSSVADDLTHLGINRNAVDEEAVPEASDEANLGDGQDAVLDTEPTE